MIATMPDRSTSVPAAQDSAAVRPESASRRRADGDDPAVERRRRSEGLVTIAGGRRELLEDLRSRYVRRLHRDSADFEATEGLRVVETALSVISRPEPERSLR